MKQNFCTKIWAIFQKVKRSLGRLSLVPERGNRRSVSKASHRVCVGTVYLNPIFAKKKSFINYNHLFHQQHFIKIIVIYNVKKSIYLIDVITNLF